MQFCKDSEREEDLKFWPNKRCVGRKLNCEDVKCYTQRLFLSPRDLGFFFFLSTEAWERENWNVGSNGEHQSSKDYDSTYRTCIFSVSSIYCFNLIFPFVVFCRRRIQNLIFRFLQSVSSLITPSMLIRVGLLCSDSCSLSLSMWCRKLGSRFGFLSRKIWGLKEESL